MEAADPSRDTYMLWRVFADPATGRTVVAMTPGQANVFTSVYTLLLELAMEASWGIIISFIILFQNPSKTTRTMDRAEIMAWNQPELGKQC